ncbi:Imm5 family immunity protein [Bacteroides congonensis]
MNKLEYLKQQAITSIQENPKGYLDFSLRKEILSLYDTKQISFIILNTLAINKVIWDKFCSQDDTFDNALKHSFDYIIGMENKSELSIYINQLRSEVESRINNGLFSEGYILQSVERLCQEQLSDYFVPEEDEFGWDSDPETWSSLFIGSLPFSGGEENIEDMIRDLNEKYWMHFINSLSKTNTFDYTFTVHSIPSTDSSIIRIQVQQYVVNEHVMKNINYLITKFIELKKRNGWKKVNIDFYVVNGSTSIKLFSDKGKMDTIDLAVLCDEQEIPETFLEIRKDMYHISPDEGAWYSANLTIDEDDKFSISFEYDSKSEYFDKWTEPINFKEDFDNFPRAEKYIPGWLKKVLLKYSKCK